MLPSCAPLSVCALSTCMKNPFGLSTSWSALVVISASVGWSPRSLGWQRYVVEPPPAAVAISGWYLVVM